VFHKSKMKKSIKKKETQSSDNRESIELLPKNETKTGQQVNIGNVAGNVTNNITYQHVSVENLITAEEDETRNKKKKSCLERLKEIHVVFKILAALLAIFIALSPFIPKIIDGTGVETSTTANTTITTTAIATATKMPTTTMTMKKVKFITSLIPKGSLILTQQVSLDLTGRFSSFSASQIRFKYRIEL
jgi:hypothetical protein